MKPMVCLLIAAGGLLLSLPALAQKGMATSPEALRGLSHVGLQIDYQGPADRPDGLTADQLRREVTLRLNIAGLKVIADPQAAKGSKTGELYLHVRTIPLNENRGRAESYCYTISLDLLENVITADPPRVSTKACTWSEGSSMVVPSGELRSVTEMVGELAVDFVRSFEAANRITEPPVDAIL